MSTRKVSVVSTVYEVTSTVLNTNTPRKEDDKAIREPPIASLCPSLVYKYFQLVDSFKRGIGTRVLVATFGKLVHFDPCEAACLIIGSPRRV